MYLTWLTAVFVLVKFQVTETAGCQSSPDEPCEEGWSRINENLCAKHFNSPKTFHEAQKHCHTLNADLVSLHGFDEMFKVICLTRRADRRHRGIWIGAQRSGNETRYIDGSEFNVLRWYFNDQRNYRGEEACIKLNVNGWGWFSAAHCWKKKGYVCVKKVSTSTADP